jgi:predicted anti-sigma-YlaC factor YlaD
VLLNSDRCPAQFNVIAEAYVMNTLARVDAAVYEEHLLTCDRCRAAVEDAEHYVRTMKIAAQRLRTPKARTAGGGLIL